jgi:hypothetical protein
MTPLFNGASVGSTIKTISYIKNPKLHFFIQFKTGYYVPIAYLVSMSCFFNISYAKNMPA